MRCDQQVAFRFQNNRGDTKYCCAAHFNMVWSALRTYTYARTYDGETMGCDYEVGRTS